MSKKTVFLVGGSLVGAVVNVLFNLIAAGIQQRAFRDQISSQSIWWMIGCALLGLVLGYWLSLKGEAPGNSNIPRSGIRARGLTSGGGVIADVKGSGGIYIEKVNAKEDILLSSNDMQPSTPRSSSDTQPSTPPKAPPPA